MKKLIIIPLLLFAVTVSAQQYYNYSQYNRNIITYNPAFTGIEGYLDINGSWRKQWDGQKGAPEVFSLSAHGRLRDDNRDNRKPPYSLRISNSERYNALASDTAWRENSPHAIGGYMIADRYEINDYSLFLTYAYHLRVSSDWTLAAGAAVGAENTQLPDYLALQEGDPLLRALGDNGETRFDFNLGLAFYSRRFFIGYGATQLSRKKLFDVQGENLDGTTFSNELLSMRVHHMVNLGYRIRVSPSVEVYPNAQLRYVDGAPISIDGTLKGRFSDVLMAGLTLRFDGNENVAGAGMIGFTLDKWNFSYSYDYPFNDLKHTSMGSHEISVGLSLYKLYEHPAKFLW
jgi:type IX secretion system PorP/SprF family membrane protein